MRLYLTWENRKFSLSPFFSFWNFLNIEEATHHFKVFKVVFQVIFQRCQAFLSSWFRNVMCMVFIHWISGSGFCLGLPRSHIRWQRGRRITTKTKKQDFFQIHFNFNIVSLCHNQKMFHKYSCLLLIETVGTFYLTLDYKFISHLSYTNITKSYSLSTFYLKIFKLHESVRQFK